MRLEYGVDRDFDILPLHLEKEETFAAPEGVAAFVEEVGFGHKHAYHAVGENLSPYLGESAVGVCHVDGL